MILRDRIVIPLLVLVTLAAGTLFIAGRTGKNNLPGGAVETAEYLRSLPPVLAKTGDTRITVEMLENELRRGTGDNTLPRYIFPDNFNLFETVRRMAMREILNRKFSERCISVSAQTVIEELNLQYESMDQRGRDTLDALFANHRLSKAQYAAELAESAGQQLASAINLLFFYEAGIPRYATVKESECADFINSEPEMFRKFAFKKIPLLPDGRMPDAADFDNMPAEIKCAAETGASAAGILKSLEPGTVSPNPYLNSKGEKMILMRLALPEGEVEFLTGDPAMRQAYILLLDQKNTELESRRRQYFNQLPEKETIFYIPHRQIK